MHENNGSGQTASPRWAARIAGLCIGWLTFLLLLATSLIALTFLNFENNRELIQSRTFLAAFAFAAILFFATGLIAARWAHRWLLDQEPRLVYLCLLITSLLTLMTFPQLLLLKIP